MPFHVCFSSLSRVEEPRSSSPGTQVSQVAWPSAVAGSGASDDVLENLPLPIFWLHDPPF